MISTEKIRALNNDLRTLRGEGRICVTTGIARLDDKQQAEIMRRVFTFDAFSPDNDPYGEHDFGSFEYGGMWLMWKIDYQYPLSSIGDSRAGLKGQSFESHSHARPCRYS